MAEAGAPEAAAHTHEVNTTRLVEGLRRADPAAHAALWDRYAERLHRYIARRLGADPEAAEDVLVQTMVDAARNIRQFEARRSEFAAWLFGIARRHTLLELRRLRRRGGTVSLHEAQTEAESTDVVAQVQASRQVARLREQLSEAEMEVLVLHYVHEFSVDEIGQIVGRSRRATNSLLHRARTKARERLREDD